MLEIILSFILQFGLLYAVFIFNQHFLMDFPLVTRMVIMFLCQWVFLIVPALLMHKNKGKLCDVGFQKSRIAMQIVVGLTIAAIMSLVLTIIPILFGQKDMVSSTRYSQTWQFVFHFFYTVFGVGLVEEFYFRGYLYKKLLDFKPSKLFTILISSVAFGLFHMFSGNLIQVIITTLIGVFYCVCREKIKHCTLLSLIIAHGVYDSLIVLCVSLM